MTIGIDLGDVWSHYCTLNEDGEVVGRGRFRTSPSGVEKWFTDLPPVRIAMEGGTHSKKRFYTGAFLWSGQTYTVTHPVFINLATLGLSLYVSQNPVEKAKLLKMLFSNCSVDAVSVTPTYRKPFDMIFKRAGLEEWSGQLDSN